MKVRRILRAIQALIVLYGAILTAQEVWRESTFEDFVDGTFDDAGANMYVSHNGRIQTVNRWDVNDDGNIDILCVNSHPLIEMLDMSIYWGNGRDFSIKNHSYVPANGPMWVAPGDLNNDGEIDLVVANYSNGTWTDMDSFVYFGGLKDRNHISTNGEWGFYPFKSKIALPGSNAQKPAIGDFNNDGYPDIVFAFSGGFWEYRSNEGYSPSRIYWGSQDGFDAQHFTNLNTRGATDVAVADFDKDGWLDLVFSNSEGVASFVYFGSSQGFPADRLTKLPTTSPHAVKAGDVNNDGSLDIVFANEQGEVSYVYLSEQGQFDAARKIELETHAAKDIVIADFDNDGFTDLFFTNHQYSLTGDPSGASRLIDSYLYYGSKKGFSSESRLSLPTIGAWGANAEDLNHDGWMDLLICNFQEHYSYEVPSFIYWNAADGFSVTRRTPLYEHGAQGNAIADFNSDGNPDILITSMMGQSRGDYDLSYLYLGSDNGNYSPANRLELPGREAYEQAFADLDDDGQVDVLLLNRGETTRQTNELWIYWNNDNAFDPWRLSGLPAHNGLGVEVADLDRNGFLDIIISNGPPLSKNANGEPVPGSFIYWGGPDGWPVAGRTELPVVWTRSAGICDLNDDGYLDLVFGQQRDWGDASVFYGNGSREFTRVRIPGSNGSGTPGVADLNKDGLLDIAFAHDKHVLVYYQQEGGTFEDGPIMLPVQAKTMCVADVNGDDWLDLVCPYYKGGGKRSWFSTVLLGSLDGYNIERAIKLATDGGTGSMVGDFNHDGFADIFFFCHRADGSYDQIGNFGDHHTNSLLYWGGSDGFGTNNRLEIPSVGAHYDMGVDLGHIKDRGFVFEYVSSPYPAHGRRPVRVTWQAQARGKSSIKLQMRVSDSLERLDTAQWFGSQGVSTFFTGYDVATGDCPTGDWLQYKAIFDTGDGVYSPVLEAVDIMLE